MPVWAPPLIGFRNWLGYTPTIPKLYWDVYSEEERIKKICMALHKIEEYLNYQTDTVNKILEHFDDYGERIEALEAWRVEIDAHLADVDSTLESLAEEDAVLHELVDALDNALAAYKEEVSEKFAEQKGDYTALVDAEHHWNVAEHARINEAWRHADADLKRDLHAEIAGISFDTLLTLDPTTGELAPVAEVFQNIYDTLRYFAITAGQFDNLSLTAQQFDSKLMTAQQFDLYGYTLLTGGSVNDPVIPVAEIDALGGRVSEVENGITAIDGEIGTLNVSLGTVRNYVEELQDGYAELNTALEGYQESTEAQMENLAQEFEGKASALAQGVNEAVTASESLVLETSRWSGNAYDVGLQLASADNHAVGDSTTLVIGKTSTMTEEQSEAFDAAKLVGNSNGTVITATGNVPAIDIPVTVARVDSQDVQLGVPEGGE